MDNYKIHKIKLADRKASEQVQELLTSVGLKWSTKNPEIIHPFEYPLNLFINWKEEKYFSGYDSRAEEIDLAQLYDFVLGERNKREQKDQGLISGAEALRALADGKEVEFEIPSKNEWRNILSDPWDLNIILNDLYGHKFRLKPTTLTVNAELPKPSNTTLHNQNYSVTYEFSSREARNAFVEGLGGNNS